MKIEVQIAPMKYLDRLYEIETECFDQDAFTKEYISQFLDAYNSIGLMASAKGEIVGFSIAEVRVGRNAWSAVIVTIDVLPHWRLKGVGRTLLQEMEKELKKRDVKAVRLEVRENNVAAISLYKNLGYREIGRLRNYYVNTDSLYLEKVL